MEVPTNSSPMETGATATAAACSEETGWTEYFEEFLASEKRSATSRCSSRSGGGSYSLVSDAASCALDWNESVGTAMTICYPVSEEKSFRDMGLKKRKTKGVVIDESLEDTASSPVSSPKLGDSDMVDTSPRTMISEYPSLRPKIYSCTPFTIEEKRDG